MQNLLKTLNSLAFTLPGLHEDELITLADAVAVFKEYLKSIGHELPELEKVGMRERVKIEPTPQISVKTEIHEEVIKEKKDQSFDLPSDIQKFMDLGAMGERASKPDNEEKRTPPGALASR